MAKRPAHTADTARKIWLAGIGAYGRAFSEAQETVAKLTDESARVFDDLVAKGEAIEKQVEERGRRIAAKAAPASLSLDDRIRRMRERIGLGEDHHSLADEVNALRARVAELEDKVEALSRPAKKPTAKKKSAKKKTA
ncbi:MAG: phasin family protein [Parvularculaceae bacterium]|nr:phasin family protein [Parvularculaceae bacterium]